MGLREVRIVGKHGTSTAWPFEVSQTPNVIETESNNDPESATIIQLPSLINGVVNPGGDDDYYVFEGTKGQRCVFSVKAYRLNNVSQQFFNPTIAVFSADGIELARSNGFYSLDPLIDITLPEDGPYLLRIRDLLHRGNPDSVYRLTGGVLPYNTYLFPRWRNGTYSKNGWHTSNGEDQSVVIRTPVPIENQYHSVRYWW